MQLNVNDICAGFVGFEAFDGLNLRGKECHEDMRRGGIIVHENPFPSIRVSREDVSIEVLGPRVPAYIRHACNHFWKHSLVPAFKWTQFLRPPLAQRKQFVLHLFFSNYHQIPTPRKGLPYLANSCKLTQNCNDCNTKRDYRFNNFVSGAYACNVRPRNIGRFAYTELSTISAQGR